MIVLFLNSNVSYFSSGSKDLELIALAPDTLLERSLIGVIVGVAPDSRLDLLTGVIVEFFDIIPNLSKSEDIVVLTASDCSDLLDTVSIETVDALLFVDLNDISISDEDFMTSATAGTELSLLEFLESSEYLVLSLIGSVGDFTRLSFTLSFLSTSPLLLTSFSDATSVSGTFDFTTFIVFSSCNCFLDSSDTASVEQLSFMDWHDNEASTPTLCSVTTLFSSSISIDSS